MYGAYTPMRARGEGLLTEVISLYSRSFKYKLYVPQCDEGMIFCESPTESTEISDISAS